jgi:hypothetical protein
MASSADPIISTRDSIGATEIAGTGDSVSSGTGLAVIALGSPELVEATGVESKDAAMVELARAWSVEL